MTSTTPIIATEQAVCDALAARQQQMLDDLVAHVAIPTCTGYASGLDRYRGEVTGRLERLGATIEHRAGAPRPEWLALPDQAAAAADTPPPVVIAAPARRDDHPCVLIAGHLDTVHDPHGDFDRVTIAPDGKTATGPGVVDMKGGVLIALHVLEVLAAEGIEHNWTFLLNSDEERGSFQSIDILRDVARDHDYGIALEPALADGSLAIERMGSGQFKVEVFGKSAHVGRAFADGVSAVTKLGALLGEIADMADAENGLIVNVGPLRGGGVTNAVPDYAAAWGNIRFKDAAAGERLGAMLDALATEDDAMPRVVVHRAFNRPAKPKTPEVEQFATQARRVAEALGQQLPFASTGGVCDGNILQDVGLPTIDTLGVRGGNLHRPDEWIDLTSLVERSQLLAVLLMRLAAG